ncbi:MAG: hypothetical protein RLZZ316_1060 [Bacteroidota bacterium]|jgi:RNA polymerase sigma-70 factor (ECF subfamily)
MSKLQLKAADLGAFMQEHQGRIYNAALNLLQNQLEAEEVTQDVFLEAYNKQQNFKGDASISTWLYRIAINKCIDILRKKQRRLQWTHPLKWMVGKALLPIEPADFVHPGIVTENKEKAAILYSALLHLPVNQRTAYLLHDTEHLSYKQISEVLETSIPAVESLLFRARQNLRKSIEKYYKD